MGNNPPPITLKAAKTLFRMLLDYLDYLPVEYTEHFNQRMREREINAVELQETLKKGIIKKEFRPDTEHPKWRWCLCHGKCTIVLSYTFDDPPGRIVFITIWKGVEPSEGEK